MTPTNIIPMNRSAYDPELMMRLCNTPKQQERRQAKRKQSRRASCIRQSALHTFLVAVGGILGFAVGVFLF